MHRYYILAAAFLCMTFLVANSSLFHFTVICMAPSEGINGTGRVFTALEESWIFSALSLGRLIGSFPAVQLMNRYGLKTCFTLFGFLSGLTTILLPLGNSFYVMLFVRLVQGCGMSAAFVAIGVVPMICGKDKEKNLMMSILSCSFQFGPCLVMPVAGYFCSTTFGWEATYYLFGGATIATFVLFFFFMTQAEAQKKRKVFNEHPSNRNDSRIAVPYKEMFLCASLWGVFMSAFGEGIGFNVYQLYGPIYINKVLNFEIAHTGILVALPYVLTIVTKTLGGVVLDRALCISEHVRVFSFTSVNLILMTVCFVFLTMLTASMQIVGEVLLTASLIFGGLTSVGFMGASQIISKQFNYVSTSVLAFIDGLIGLLMPVLVGLLAPNHSKEEWRIVFYCFIGTLVVTIAFYVSVTKVRPAKWTFQKSESAMPL
uniref:MFS domain-containing protein n=1 Tax=Steinernema glaseri TaxID=37863 RepID=A0A1I7Y3N2_9BILA